MTGVTLQGQAVPPGGPEPRNVPALLLGLRAEKFNGSVRVAGSPGGTIHLRDGLVGAIETPGTPTVESILLKSGRVEDDAWAAVRTTGRQGDRIGSELVARGFVGAAELEVVCTAAVFEGAFAMALSLPGGWEVGPGNRSSPPYGWGSSPSG